ncbi:MAG TPA: nucleotidyltransferase domain-containing protein [Solirubrobacteraceae bacterium]
MNVAHPISAVSPSLEGEVLQTLAGTSMAMTGRQVAALTGRTSHSGVLDALNRLTQQGLVDRVELNRASLFSLNRDHLAAPAVIELAGLRTELVARIRSEIATWDPMPIHASLFGSAARGDGDTRSHIDLFVVRPADVLEDDDRWRAQVDGLAGRIERWTGNRASISEVAEPEIPRLSIDPPPIVEQLRSDAIVFAGRALSDLLGE